VIVMSSEVETSLGYGKQQINSEKSEIPALRSE
jgi:hypothetical protein